MNSVKQDGLAGAPTRIRPDVGFVLAIAGVLLLLWSLLYRDTVWSMVLMWIHSQTFTHGFLIVPLSAYLVYERRESLRNAPIEPCVSGVVALLVLCAVWIAGWSATTEVVQQFAVVGMLIACIVMLFGLRFSRHIAGPLAYLFFAVPFGEILIYPLREFTTNSIVLGLNLTGISVVRSGFYLSTSAGDFAVEDACSGLRYLIASIALGTLFAMLYLTSMRRRLTFILLSLIVPVFANGVRAYLIVSLAHISSLRIAAGVDHLIYGWIFFGVVMLLLFWFGMRMEDRSRSSVVQSTAASPDVRTVQRTRVVIAALAALTALFTGPTIARVIEAREATQTSVTPTMPSLVGWTGSAPKDSSWVPAFPGRLGLATRSYLQASANEKSVDVTIAWYRDAKLGGAMIGVGNHSIDNRVWRERSYGTRSIETQSGRHVAFATVEIEAPPAGRRRAVWYVYLVDTVPVANDYWGKALQAWTRIVSPGRALWSLAFSAESVDPSVDPSAVLAAFTREYFESFTKHSAASGASL